MLFSLLFGKNPSLDESVKISGPNNKEPREGPSEISRARIKRYQNNRTTIVPIQLVAGHFCHSTQIHPQGFCQVALDSVGDVSTAFIGPETSTHPMR